MTHRVSARSVGRRAVRGQARGPWAGARPVGRRAARGQGARSVGRRAARGQGERSVGRRAARGQGERPVGRRAVRGQTGVLCGCGSGYVTARAAFAGRRRVRVGSLGLRCPDQADESLPERAHRLFQQLAGRTRLLPLLLWIQ